jgi:hypothetical protein
MSLLIIPEEKQWLNQIKCCTIYFNFSAPNTIAANSERTEIIIAMFALRFDG